MLDFPFNPTIETNCIAFVVEPNVYTQQQIMRAQESKSPLSFLRKKHNDPFLSIITPNNPMWDKRYMILVCFENKPGATKKVFDAMNEIFCDIAGGLGNDWTLTEAAQNMQELLAEHTDVECCCIPMETVDVF